MLLLGYVFYRELDIVENNIEKGIGTLTKFKLVFLGEQSVGKTSLITRYRVCLKFLKIFQNVSKFLKNVSKFLNMSQNVPNLSKFLKILYTGLCTIHLTTHTKQQLGLIFCRKRCIWTTKQFACNCGILQDKSVFVHSSLLILGADKLQNIDYTV